MRHVIIGNSAAGVFAAEAIRRRRPADTILILSDELEPAYSRCLTSYYIAGRVSEESMRIRPDSFYRDWNLEFRGGTRAVAVDAGAARVETAAGESIAYDRLLIASGARAVRPEIPGIDGPGVFTLRSLADARAIAARARYARNAVVVGGGLVSLKAAYGLIQRHLGVTMVVSSRQILSQVMGAEGAVLVKRHLETKGMRFLMGEDITEILHGESGCRQVRLASGAALPADLVVVGKGVTPNTEFLAGTGVQVRQGVVVNNYLETSVPRVYAAGDAAETRDRLTGEPAVHAIWPNATAQGEVAGYNMAGDGRAYAGSLGMNSLELFGLATIVAGVTRPQEGDTVWRDARHGSAFYRELIFRHHKLVGFTLVGHIARAGVLTAMLGREADPATCLEALAHGAARFV